MFVYTVYTQGKKYTNIHAQFEKQQAHTHMECVYERVNIYTQTLCTIITSSNLNKKKYKKNYNSNLSKFYLNFD